MPIKALPPQAWEDETQEAPAVTKAEDPEETQEVAAATRERSLEEIRGELIIRVRQIVNGFEEYDPNLKSAMHLQIHLQLTKEEWVGVGLRYMHLISVILSSKSEGYLSNHFTGRGLDFVRYLIRTYRDPFVNTVPRSQEGNLSFFSKHFLQFFKLSLKAIDFPIEIDITIEKFVTAMRNYMNYISNTES